MKRAEVESRGRTSCDVSATASRLILIAGDILINTPPCGRAAPHRRTARHPKETETFLRAFATQRKKGRKQRGDVVGQSRRVRAAGGPMRRECRGGRAHAAAPSFRSGFLFIVARNTARDGRVMRV